MCSGCTREGPVIPARALAPWQDSPEGLVRNNPWNGGRRAARGAGFAKGIFHNQQEFSGDVVKGVRGSFSPTHRASHELGPFPVKNQGDRGSHVLRAPLLKICPMSLSQ